MSILDDDLETLADAPSNDAWPAGSYIADFSVTVLEKEGKSPTIIMGYKFIECAELTNPSDAEAPNMPKQIGKDQTATVHALMKKDGTKNEIGQGQVKSVLKIFNEAGYPGNIKGWAEQVKADKPKVAVTFKCREDRSTGDKRNEVVSLSLIGA
jgi:hypothetical protein